MAMQFLVKANRRNIKTRQMLPAFFTERLYPKNNWIYLIHNKGTKHKVYLKKLDGHLTLYSHEWKTFLDESGYMNFSMLHFIREEPDLYYVTAYNDYGFECNGYNDVGDRQQRCMLTLDSIKDADAPARSSLAKPNHINGGFSLDLIDRDSPQSPLYNPTYAQFDRLKEALRRSTSRASHLSKRAGFSSNNASFNANISAGLGEYLMSIKIGTPPVKVVGVVDTAVDLTWAQCKPCVHCYKQVGPLLVPSNSSTYRALSCQSKGCKALDKHQLPCDSSNKCRYETGYVKGNLAVDTFWFGSTPVKNVIFGCGHDNEGAFEENASGVIGLGGGPVSIIKQLDSAIKGKFSYCLIPYSNNNTNQTSKIHFGTHANIAGPNVVSTPLIKKDPSTFYYLTLESMLVGKHNVSTQFPLSPKEGNIIIDSNTLVTSVPDEFYTDLINAITKVIGNGIVQEGPVSFEYCYKNLNLDRVPSVTFRFTGADVVVPPENMFLEIEKGVSCLTLFSSLGLSAIFGNLSQRNMLVGYDLVNRKVSFKPTDCTKHA
ncbi:eukaryotic aspartyl protease family protein [Artemisia annua]|uniref:Eukaryotic aspartyl protease family protein n=1 Tax=Artemisia annua TaxID=35608 RepID=A0A2U1L7I5_ARTAN|nr:eukaryotic aspartyl protease family protein [Artemisia annua]